MTQSMAFASCRFGREMECKKTKSNKRIGATNAIEMKLIEKCHLLFEIETRSNQLISCNFLKTNKKSQQTLFYEKQIIDNAIELNLNVCRSVAR